MTALKEAAHNLLTTLKNAEKTPGDIKVSIVPFAIDVNVGTGNVNATGSTGPTGKPSTAPAASRRIIQQSNCTCGNTRTPEPGRRPTTASGTAASTTATRTTTCSTPRPAPAAATMYRAHQASNCPASMMPLSSDWTALNSKVDAMTPTGNTNVTIGLQMAWQTLSRRSRRSMRPRPRPTSTRSSSC